MVEVLVAGFEESDRKTSELCRKMFARARLVLSCDAPHDVGDVFLVFRERFVGDSVGPCGYYLHSACLAEGLRVQVLRGCSERHRFCVYCGELLHGPAPYAQIMELCRAPEELHVELEELHLEQFRARDELPLMQQWPRGIADDCATLPADLETMDPLTTTKLQPTLRAAEPRRLRNDLRISSVPGVGQGGCVHMKCDNPRCQREFCCLCLHDWTSATYNALFCIGRAEASHSEVLAFVEKQMRSNWALHAHDTQSAVDIYAKEVLQWFRVALTTRLERDAKLLWAEEADVSLRWRRFL